MNRNVAIASTVVVFHVAALWALQSGLLRRAVEIVVPVAVLSEILEPPRPKAEPAPPAPQPPAPVKQPVVRRAVPTPPPPLPVAGPAPDPTPMAPEAAPAPSAPPSPVLTAPVAAAAPPAAPAPAAPARVELPSSDADYLQNPKPAYPPISKRLGEQGKVTHRVVIGADGVPISATLVASSGYPRLDQAAYQTVMRWRYVPGKRNGVATPMAFNVPIHWVLE